MKIRLVQDSQNQHIVAVEQNGDIRCYFKNASIHTAGAAAESLRRDIARHGTDVAGIGEMPRLLIRIAKSGRKIYDLQ